MTDQIAGRLFPRTQKITSDAVVVELVRDAGAIARYLMSAPAGGACCARCGDPAAQIAALLSVPLEEEPIEWALCVPCLIEFPARDTLYYKLL